MFKNRKLGFIGAGHLAQAMIRSLIETKTIEPSQIWISNRSEGKLKRVQEHFQVNAAATNEQLVDECDIVFLAVKPQDMLEAVESVSSAFQSSHLVISLAVGISISELERLVPNRPMIVRVMPNTAVSIQKSVTGYCLSERAKSAEGLIQALLSPMGLVVPCLEGEEFQALMVSCSSGIGFVTELMIYWQEWLEEHGFEANLARDMTVQTFLGASLSAEKNSGVGLSELQDRVVSKKGITAAGLQSMRELEVERAMRYSFEKAVIRENELQNSTKVR